MFRFLAILFLTSCLTTTVAASDIDFRQSKIAPETEKVHGGAMVTVNVVLTNTGDKLSDGTDLTISFPRNGFFIRIDELPGLKRDDDAREISARVNIPAGGEYRFAFVLLASRSEENHHLSTHIEVRNLLADDLVAARWNSDVSVKITSVPTKGGVIIGGLKFNPPPIGVVVWMVITVVMLVWLRFRMNWKLIPACGLVAFVMFPFAFVLIAGGMAWRDLQTLTSWNEAQATILDRREAVRTSSENRSASDFRKGFPSRQTTTHKPDFALRYQVGEREVISSGFDTGSSINVGGQIIGKAAMDDWVAGKIIPCWYDPDDPAVVVVRRGLGGAILFFGLFPLPFLWFGFRQLREVINLVRQLKKSDLDVAKKQ